MAASKQMEEGIAALAPWHQLQDKVYHVPMVHCASGFTIINAATGNILIKAIRQKGNVVFWLTILQLHISDFLGL